MEHGNIHIPEKCRRNDDFYKNIWLSLFELRILSSCEESDFDLFGASVLLKSALHQFEKLKKRLNDSHNLVETLKFELKKTKLENDNFTQKLNDLKTTDCTHCQCLKGIQSYSEGCVWNSEYHSEGIEGSKEYNKTHDNLRLKNHSSRLCNQKSVPEAHRAGECPLGTSDGGGPVSQDGVSLACLALNMHKTPKLPSLEIDRTICLPSAENLVTSENTGLKTPEKQLLLDHSLGKSSPVLNSQKRAKRFALSPSKSGSNPKPPSRNTRSPSFLMPGVDSSEVEALCNETAVNSSSECKGRAIGANFKKKQKILSLRLKRELLSDSQSTRLPRSEASSAVERCHRTGSGAEEVESFPNTPPTKIARGRPDGMGQTSPQPSRRSKSGATGVRPPAHGDLVSPGLSFVPKSAAVDAEEEDELIIMPSPNSLQGHCALIDVDVQGVHLIDAHCNNTSNKVGDGACQLDSRGKKSRKIREPPHVETDTEVTYFAPKNESSEEEEEEEEEEGGGDDEGIISDRDVPDKLSHCASSDAVCDGLLPPRCLLTSFDRVPPKCPSPKYKHQRAAVRKKRDRMQMEGWECKACKKYYDAAGVAANPLDRKGHVNKCSRHRDRYSPRKCTPKGLCDKLSSLGYFLGEFPLC